MANLRTTALYVWDEVYLSGFYLDSGSVNNYFVVSFNPGPTTPTAMLTKHSVGLTGCTNVEMGPFVPLSSTSIFMGLSIQLCSSIYTAVIHRYSSNFATPDKIVGNPNRYQRPEMAVAGSSSSQLFVLGRMSDNSEARISVHNKGSSTHYYVSLGVNGIPKGLYYNPSIDEVHCVLRDVSNNDIIWYIIDNPYGTPREMRTFKLMNIPATETLV